MAKILIKNWTEFQHYKERRPPWIKLHRALLDNYDFHCLPVASKALAPCLWLLASESEDGSLPHDLEMLSFRLRMTRNEIAEALKPLADAGFIVLEQGDSAPLADCLRDADSEERRDRGETEKKIEERRPTRIPENFTVSESHRAFAKKDGLPNPDGEIEKFKDHWRAQAGPKAIKRDWEAAFRNWLRKAKEFKSEQSVNGYRPPKETSLLGAKLQ